MIIVTSIIAAQYCPKGMNASADRTRLAIKFAVKDPRAAATKPFLIAEIIANNPVVMRNTP